MTDPDEEPRSTTFEDGMRDARPGEDSSGSLEKKLAIASIVGPPSTRRGRMRLGRLEVQSRLGGGAMGVVYRAYDPELQRLVAVKVLRGWLEQAERGRVADEARALAKLSHPNVVTVHDIVDDEQGLYFTMESVAGMTLRAWLDAHPEATWREVVGWFTQAGRGLAAAHLAGIVHRDFKPENVLVGDDGRARVVDFGLAHGHRGDDLEDYAAGGTPYYMSPETRSGAPATPASDQYAYCRALHDALEGRQAPALMQRAVDRGLADEAEERHADLGGLLDVLEGMLSVGEDARPRALLLERLERLWLQGVLDRSVGEGSLVDLELRSDASLVNPPWKVWGVAESSETVSSSRELSHILSESNGSLLIVGPPGCGKTTLLLLLARDLWRTAVSNPDAPAPAVLSLSTYRPETRKGRSSSEHFAAWVTDELVTKYGLPRPAVHRWFDDAGIVLLLDGLDESDSKQRVAVVETLNEFRERHPLSIVVTTRDAEYQSLQKRFTFGGAVRVQPIDDDAMVDLLEGRRALHLMQQLEDDEKLYELLRNPLMLTLYASGGGARVGIPSWTLAYDQFVSGVFAGSENPAERTRMEAQLGWLARAMRRNNTSDLWLERLSFRWLDERWARAVAYAFGVGLVFSASLAMNLSHVPFTGAFSGSGVTFAMGVAVFSFVFTGGRIKPVEQLSWSWRRAVRLLPLTILCATLMGLVEALQDNFAANMAGAMMTGAMLGVVFALEPDERESQVSPNAGIHQSLTNAFRVAVASSIPVGLAFTLVIHPYVLKPLAIAANQYEGTPSYIIGTTVGLFAFSALFLIYGGFAFIMHWVLRVWLALRTPLPLDVAAMLDRAVDLGLMRRVGGGYVFLHRTLLSYFADHGSASIYPAPGSTSLES